MDQLDGRLGLIYNKLIKHDLIHGDISSESLQSFMGILQMAIDTTPRENHIRDFIRHLSRRCDVLTFLRNANVPQWGLLSDGPTITRLLGIDSFVTLNWDSRARVYDVLPARAPQRDDLARPPPKRRTSGPPIADGELPAHRLKPRRGQDSQLRGRGDRGRGRRGRGIGIVPPMSNDQYAVLLSDGQVAPITHLDRIRKEMQDSGWVSDNDN